MLIATHSSHCTVICHLKVTSNLQLYTAKCNLQSQFVTSSTQCGLHYQQNTAANLQLYTRQYNLHHVNLALRAHNDILPCQFAAHNTKCNLQLCVTQQTEICNASLHVPPTPHSAVIYTVTDASPCNLSAYVHTTNTTQVLQSIRTPQLQRKRRQGKKDQRPRSNSGPTLYRGVSATRATETGRDPPSPIALMYRSQADVIQRHLGPVP